MSTQEISDMQRTISERFEKVKSALIGGRLAPRVQNQIKPILVDVEAGNESIDKLIEQGEFLTARETAREIQKKVFKAELIMAGKKPAS